MKLLFISSWFPYPPLNGAKIRIFNLVRELARHGHEIDLLAQARTIPLEEAAHHRQTLRQYCRTVEVVQARTYEPDSLRARRGLLSRYPSSISATYNQELARLVGSAFRARRHDVVIASEVGPPALVSLLASKLPHVPVILDALEIGRTKNAYEHGSTVTERLRHGLTWFKLQAFVRHLLKRGATVTVPSAQEQRNFGPLASPDTQVAVIPHGLDLNGYAGSFDEPRQGAIVFTGSFGHDPNRDAVEYFFEHIHHLVIDREPNATVQVVGSTEGTDISTWMARTGVTFTGLLRDVRPVVASSWVSAVPLRQGAGTRLKIVESMALGTPVVSTSKGSEGLDVTDGKNILIADDPAIFAQKLVSVLRTPSLRHELSAQGRRLVEEKYSSMAMGTSFNDLLTKVAASRRL